MSDTIIFSIKLKSGDFSSEMHVPLPKTKEQTDRLVERWMAFMLTGLEISAERMDAVLEDEP